jgi:hypothetical protein
LIIGFKIFISFSNNQMGNSESYMSCVEQQEEQKNICNQDNSEEASSLDIFDRYIFDKYLSSCSQENQNQREFLNIRDMEIVK